jgi:hypothetical protein
MVHRGTKEMGTMADDNQSKLVMGRMTYKSYKLEIIPPSVLNSLQTFIVELNRNYTYSLETPRLMPHSLSSEYHYIRLAVYPSNGDALVLRKTLQDSLTQTFGITASATYIDILWVADGGEQFVVRVRNGSVFSWRTKNLLNC